MSMYQPESALARFSKFYIFVIFFMGVWALLFRQPYTLENLLILDGFIAAVSTYVNRPGVLLARFPDQQGLVTALKGELLKNYDWANQSNQSLFST